MLQKFKNEIIKWIRYEGKNKKRGEPSLLAVSCLSACVCICAYICINNIQIHWSHLSCVSQTIAQIKDIHTLHIEWEHIYINIRTRTYRDEIIFRESVFMSCQEIAQTISSASVKTTTTSIAAEAPTNLHKLPPHMDVFLSSSIRCGFLGIG